jgi:hypothetical protein
MWYEQAHCAFLTRSTPESKQIIHVSFSCTASSFSELGGVFAIMLITIVRGCSAFFLGINSGFIFINDTTFTNVNKSIAFFIF